jgi:gamma-carbonic anhydrase
LSISLLWVNTNLPENQLFPLMHPPEPPANQLLPTFLLPDSAPQADPSAFIAHTAVVLGSVTLGRESSVWFSAVIRGDIHSIHIGHQSNVQDGSVLHVADAHPCIIGDRVTIGHRAVVHACTVEDDVLIGMSATVLDGARIGAGSTVAAGALVPKGMQVPPRSLVLGVPAKVVRSLSDEEVAANTRLAYKYVEVSRRYLALREGGMNV